MLPGEEELEKKKKKAARPQWTHVRTIAEDVLRKVIEAENERRESETNTERESVRSLILSGSKLYKMLGNVKGLVINIDYEPASYKDADAIVEVKATDDDVIDGELTEDIKLPASTKRKLTKVEGLSTDPKSLKEAAQTIAAYVIVDMGKDPHLDMLEAISKRVSEWVKSQ